MGPKIFIFMIFIPCDLINFSFLKIFDYYYASETGDYADWKVLNWKFSPFSLFISRINNFYLSSKSGFHEPELKILTSHVGQTILSKILVLDFFEKSDFSSHSLQIKRRFWIDLTRFFSKNFRKFSEKNIWVTVYPSNWKTSLACGHQKVTKQITN